MVSIRVTCPKCGVRGKAKDDKAGKRVRCSSCGAAVPVPAPESAHVAPDLSAPIHAAAAEVHAARPQRQRGRNDVGDGTGGIRERTAEVFGGSHWYLAAAGLTLVAYYFWYFGGLLVNAGFYFMAERTKGDPDVNPIGRWCLTLLIWIFVGVPFLIKILALLGVVTFFTFS